MEQSFYACIWPLQLLMAFGYMKDLLYKLNRGLLLLVLLTVVLFYGKQILIPLFFAIMLAMLMAPLVRRLDGRGWKRIFSSLLSVLILLVIFLLIIGIVLGQFSGFIRDMPLFEQKANELIVGLHQYIERKFRIPVVDQTAFLKEETANIGAFVRGYMTGVLRSSVALVAGLIITLVVTFLLLLHKEKYYAFFLKFAANGSNEQREDVLSRIGMVAQHYLTGRAISIIFLFVLYAVALLIIGIDNALILAAVAGIFNIIPYLGPVLAAGFPVLVALVTETGYQPAIWVLITFCLFQALDNYWVTPYFLGGEVSLSALSTILAMLAGGFLWGISGMILFIPMLSIVKIILDNIPGLQHYGALIGDTGNTRPTQNLGAWFRKIFSRK
ncbi:AI-2E family transporter [Paracnuella aquatica]|uniref:AI-2E family transporter n=1 Tax=Paracnuella aquatica TaxID=2268757 RepID=UPI00138FAEB8|nr:AI-2E family transporter [Paracnuella aquatica]